MGWPGYVLQRHPLAVRAWFEYSLVLTFAVPAGVLERTLPEGLKLDVWRPGGDGEEVGFVAIAMVKMRGLRPAGMPRAMGQDFFLVGYRIFTTFKPEGGTTLRGLYILRSDTDRQLMATMGNLLTHYQYRVSRVAEKREGDALRAEIETDRAEADLRVTADIAEGGGGLPEGSAFANPKEARRFAGPLPWTFDHERETRSIIAIKGVREKWEPRPVKARVEKATFLERGALAGARLASAFYVSGIAYRWNRGIRHRLRKAGGE